MSQIDPELMEVLACPACNGEVKKDDNEIICLKCGRSYPIRDGIPIMLIEEAEEKN